MEAKEPVVVCAISFRSRRRCERRRGGLTREEDTLDGGKGDESFSESRSVVRDPFEGPVGLLLDAGNCRTDNSQQRIAGSNEGETDCVRRR